MELQSRYEELKARGVGIAVVLYDPPAVLKAFADKRGIEYPLLSDVGSDVIQR